MIAKKICLIWVIKDLHSFFLGWSFVDCHGHQTVIVPVTVIGPLRVGCSTSEASSSVSRAAPVETFAGGCIHLLDLGRLASSMLCVLVASSTGSDLLLQVRVRGLLQVAVVVVVFTGAIRAGIGGRPPRGS